MTQPLGAGGSKEDAVDGNAFSLRPQPSKYVEYVKLRRWATIISMTEFLSLTNVVSTLIIPAGQSHLR